MAEPDRFEEFLKNPPEGFDEAVVEEARKASPAPNWNQAPFPFDAITAWFTRREEDKPKSSLSPRAGEVSSRRRTKVVIGVATAAVIALVAGYFWGLGSAGAAPARPLEIASIATQQTPLRGGDLQLELLVTAKEAAFAAVISLGAERPPRVIGVSDVLLIAAEPGAIPIPNDTERAIVVLTSSPIALYVERWGDQEHVKPLGPQDDARVQAEMISLLQQLHVERFAIDSQATDPIPANN